VTEVEEDEAREQAYRRIGEFAYFWLRRFYAKFYAQVAPGLTWNQLFVLMVIARHGRVTVTRLAGDWDVSLSAITGVTDRLVRQGLVVRGRDGTDRRLVYLELTAAGEKVVADFLARRQTTIARYLDRLSLAEVEQTVVVLDRLMEIAREDDC